MIEWNNGWTPPGTAGADWDNILEMRRATAEWIAKILSGSVDQPILEVGPLQPGAPSYIDAAKFCAERGLAYQSLDINEKMPATLHGDFLSAPSWLPAGQYGTILLLHCLEHMDRFWLAPQAVQHLLRPGGRCCVLTPWNIQVHDPRPDYWRISVDGHLQLFGSAGFTIESVGAFGAPDHPLCVRMVVRKP